MRSHRYWGMKVMTLKATLTGTGVGSVLARSRASGMARRG
eukprot:CAMPEP_0197913444 /NCGR_PEP_ID=MMETSP1439-20131203/76663_1 /TAXON_ID=66791 /ORGANISM="Gonyaulax spinifera, Strain CCMP409" /LENGTH=39 /DNA_ID= /DNA_START= /DNA_END= /DNA_ORIENTATION=